MKKITLILTLFILTLALVGCVQKRNQAPVIQGAETEKRIEKGTSYNPLDGVIATDDKDGTVSVQVVGTYDINEVGEHNFTLVATDSEGLKHELAIKLTVVDTASTNLNPRLIGVVENQTYYIGTGDHNPIANVTATDPEDGIITNITLQGTFNLTVAGTYVLTVKVLDSANASASKTIVLTVVPSTVPNQLTSEPVEVLFWHGFGKDKEAIIQKYADQFKQLYPNVTITLAGQGDYDDLLNKVTSAIVAETEPTMLIGYPDHVSSYLLADAVEPLDPYVKHPTFGVDINDFVQSYINENKSFDAQGTLYGLPFNKSTEVLIYNKTFFDDNGLQVPTTWAEVEAISQVVKTKFPSSNPDYKDIYGFAYDSTANMFITLTRQWGGQYTGLGENGKGTILFDNPQTREMLAYFKDLKDRGYSTLAGTWGQKYASDPFKNQKVFMTVGSTAGIGYNVPANGAFEIGVAPIPQKDPNNKAVIQQGTNISIMKSATDQEKLAAWLFTKYLTSKDITTDWAMKTGYLPVTVSGYNSDVYQAFLNTPTADLKYVSMAANAAYLQKDYMFVDQPFIGSDEARRQVGALINSVIVTNVTINDAIANALKEIK